MLAANGSYYGTFVIDDLTAFQFPLLWNTFIQHGIPILASRPDR
jgi:hypothetical protein